MKELKISQSDDIKSVLSSLRSAEGQMFLSGDELLDVFKKTVSDVTMPAMDNLFTSLPPENLT